MTKRGVSLKNQVKTICNALNQKAFTLIELMVGIGIFGIIMLAAFGVMSTGSELAGFYSKNAATSEFLADGLTQLSSILPQVVKINACNCSGTGSSVSDCTWSDSSPWNDPVIDAGVSTGGTIFDAEYEAFYGGSGALTTDETLTSDISSVGGYSCGSHAYTSGLSSRGCRQRVRILYTAPTQESGSTTSKPGKIEIKISEAGTTSPSTTHTIGDNTTGGKQGLVALSCGLMNPESSQVGLNFVINMKMKIKKKYSENTSAAQYESWHPSGVRFDKGFFRESKLKFSFPNLFVRGAYQWRMTGIKKCIKNGSSSTTKEECCSGAISGGSCISCIRSGESGDDSSCCSEKAVSGTCQ